jgi:F-type H+-transporting ATPase subunit b
MQLDNQIIAQILTTLLAFLIFAFIAKRMFWKPLLNTIEERQANIKGEFDKIDAMQRQVDQLQTDYTKRMSDIEAEARLKLQEAMAQGKQVAEQVAEQARRDAETTREKAQQTLAIELEKARIELKQDVVRMTMAATEKVIRQNMNDARQQELVTNFVEELGRR